MLAALVASSPAQGMVHIAAVNGDKFKTFLYRYRITMYPAIEIFAKYKHSPRRYKGESSMCICVRVYVRTFVCIYICTYMCKHVCAWIVLLVKKLVKLGHSTGVSS